MHTMNTKKKLNILSYLNHFSKKYPNTYNKIQNFKSNNSSLISLLENNEKHLKNYFNTSSLPYIYESIFNKHIESNSPTKNIKNSQLNSYFLSFNIPSYNISFENHHDNIHIIWQNTNNNKQIKYNWGDSSLFNSLLSKLNIQINDLQPLYLNQEFANTSIYNYSLPNTHLTLNNLNYLLSQNVNNELNLKKDKKLIVLMEEMKDILMEKRDIEYLQRSVLGDIRTLYEFYKYIHKHIYPFMKFDNYTYTRIKDLYQKIKYQFEFKDTWNEYFPNIHNYKFNWLKKYTNNPQSILYIIHLLELYTNLFELYIELDIKNSDIVLSLLTHQYDSSLLTHSSNSKYKIRNDINRYYENKYKFISYLKNHDNHKIYSKVPLILNNGMFFDVEIEEHFPFDDIYNNESLIVGENFYSDINNLQRNLEEKILNGKLLSNNKQKIKKKIVKTKKSKKGGDIDITNYFKIDELNELKLEKNKKPSKYAYCSLLYGNNQYFLETMAFGYNMYMTGTPYDRLLLVTKDVPFVQIEQLSRFFNRIFLIDNLNIDKKLFATKTTRWYGVFDKLHAFYFDEYEKIIMLDTDLLVKFDNQDNKNKQSYCVLDALFDQIDADIAGMSYDKKYMFKMNAIVPPEIEGKFLKEKKGAYSSGVLMLKPSKKIFYDMLTKIDKDLSKNIKKKGYVLPEEGFITDYFRGKWRTISGIYNYTPLWINRKWNLLGVSNEVKKINPKDIKVVHFVHYKCFVMVEEPLWFYYEKSFKNIVMDKYKKLWIKNFLDMEELCTKETKNTPYKPIISIRDFCSRPTVSFV